MAAIGLGTLGSTWALEATGGATAAQQDLRRRVALFSVATLRGPRGQELEQDLTTALCLTAHPEAVAALKALEADSGLTGPARARLERTRARLELTLSRRR